MLRHTVRSLLKSPGFTFISIAALAVGIGGNTALFGLVNAVILRAAPYRDPGRLVMIWQQTPSGDKNGVSAGDFLDWREWTKSFTQIAAFTGEGFNLVDGDRAEKLAGLRVSSSLFSILGNMPTIGRAFSPEDEKPGSNLTVILSDGFWMRRFGGDPHAVGKTIRLNEQTYTIIGVMPRGFEFWGKTDLWAPLALQRDRAKRNFYYLAVLARLRPDVTVNQARAEMAALARQLALDYPKTNIGWGAQVVPLAEQLAGDARTPLLVLLGAVAFVLLIACANVANLLLVRTAGRRSEFAIRAALGAGRFDVVGRVVGESLMLACAGGALGILAAHGLIRALIWLHPDNVPRLEEGVIDGPVLAFTVAVSIATGIVFGLLAALQFVKSDVSEALSRGRSVCGSGLGDRTRNGLIVAEIALALVLLIGAGLMLRSFDQLLHRDTGFRTDNLLTMSVTVQEQRYATEQALAAEFDRVVDSIRQVPGVVDAASATNLPVYDWNQGRAFTIEGRPPKYPGEIQGAGYMSVSTDYFRTAGIPLLKGREFSVQDRGGAPNVVIVSESLARRFWPGENPIGKRIACASVEYRARSLGPPIPREIVGVAGDVRHVGLDSELSVEMYVPQSQNTLPFTYLLVRTSGDPLKLAPAIAQAVNGVHKDFPVSAAKTMEQLLGDSRSRPRFQLLLLGLFAIVALLLATLGIYGVMAYAVAQRTQEIGVRMALGAGDRQIMEWVLWHGLKLALAGVLIGLGAAFVSTRIMAKLLYRVPPTDASTFAIVSAVLMTTALAASVIRAWRASRTDPANALRAGRL